MKEDFLHYVWQNKKIDFANLQTTQGEPIQILHSGNYWEQAGPDFFNAQLIIGTQKWAGNIEIHLKSSDWYLHHHERDQNYDNVILHVVWDHDMEVFRKDNSEIPALELKNNVDSNLVFQYQKLKAQKTWIYCENEIKNIPLFILKNWQERLFFERLEKKANPIFELLKTNNNDWEATFFCFLAKNFGLNINGEAFFQLAQSIPFSVIRKEAFDVHYLEALFFGQAHMLSENSQENYSIALKNTYDYLFLKYKLEQNGVSPIQFFRLRPDNFPTIRLAQLAMVYHTHRNLFSSVIKTKNISEIYSLFEVSVSEYWLEHYNFEKPSQYKNKALSKSFVNLLISNTILPFKFAYDTSLGKDVLEVNTYMLEQIEAEKNAIVDRFKTIGLTVDTAFQSQALLQLKKEYCSYGKCLQCAIGVELLKN